MKLYSQAIAGDEHDAALFCNRAAAYLGTCSRDAALDDAQKAVKLMPDWTKAHYRCAPHDRKGSANRSVCLIQSLSSPGISSCEKPPDLADNPMLLSSEAIEFTDNHCRTRCSASLQDRHCRPGPATPTLSQPRAEHAIRTNLCTGWEACLPASTAGRRLLPASNKAWRLTRTTRSWSGPAHALTARSVRA